MRISRVKKTQKPYKIGESKQGTFDFLDSGVAIESPHTTQVKQFIFSQQNEDMTNNFNQDGLSTTDWQT
jgi:hypothetical protein